MLPKVYSKPNCPKCLILKRFLTDNKIPHTYIDVSEDEAEFQILVDNGLMTLPIVHDGERFLDDFNQILNKFKQQKETQCTSN